MPCSVPRLARCNECLSRLSCLTLQVLFLFPYEACAHHFTLLSQAHFPLLRWTRTSSCRHHSAWVPSLTLYTTKQLQHDESAAPSAPPIDHSPSPALLERLSADQRSSFLQTRNRLPSHMREIAFDPCGPGWTPAAITQLGNFLAAFHDVFSKYLQSWLWLFASLQYLGSSELLSRHVSAVPHRPPSGRGLVQIILNRPHPTLHVAMGEPSRCQPQEIRWHPNHGQRQEAEKTQPPWRAPHPSRR